MCKFNIETTADVLLIHNFDTLFSEKYLRHLQKHKDKEKQRELKECPHCKKMVKGFSLGPHVQSCKRKINQECKFVEHRTVYPAK